MVVNDLRVGDVVNRRELQDEIGGQRYGGIATPRDHPYVLLFTDPNKGREFGYDRYEGPTEDGGYSYTGEGQDGDQEFIRGNLAILEAPDQGKSILLFKAHSPLATYIGEFFLGDPPYSIRRAPDSAGRLRNVIVFNLMPFAGNPSLLQAEESRERQRLVRRPWTAPDYSSYEVNSTVPVSEADRREFELQARFGKWLESHGERVETISIRTAHGTLNPDLYVPSRNLVVEAKKSGARKMVREAIGQVLDYQFCLSRYEGVSAEPVIVIPEPANPDLHALAKHLGVTIFFPDNDSFIVQ